VPALGPEVLPRPRLVEQLNQGTRRRLTLVAAPAGFGKTTAVAIWVAETRSPVAWLSLEESDNALDRFVAHLVAATRSGWHGGRARTAPRLAGGPQGGNATLHSLLDELGRQGSPLTLVLDEFDVLRSTEVLAAIAFVLDHQPPNLHLVLCTRHEPRLHLPRLRARGQLAEITADDLRFTFDEAALFLEQAMALELSPQSQRALHERTEGWITGLQLAALSLHRTTDRDAFIASFAGDHRQVADYLIEEVLSQQPPAVQEFLQATSLLRRLSGELCDAVTGGNGSGELLEQLAEENLFVRRLDEQRRWYRYHGLFAELLRHRLAARAPEAIPTLHGRAAAWLEAHGTVAEATHHALAGGDVEHASRLVRQHGEALLARGEDRALLEWLRALPEEELALHPELGAIDALARLSVRDIEGSARRLAALEEQLARLAIPTPSLYGFARTVAAAVALLRDEIGRALELGLEAESPDGDLPPTVAGLAEAVSATARFARGELVEARIHAERGLATALARANPRAVFHLGALVARIDLREGRLRRAEAGCRELLDWAVKNGCWDVSFRAATQLALAEALYERGALSEAQEVLESAADLAGRLGPDELEDLVAEWRVRVRRARGVAADPGPVDPEHAARQELHLHLFDPPAYHRLRWRLAAGEAVAVESELRRRGLDPHDTAPDPGREREYLLLARTLVARGRAVEAQPLIARLLLAADAGGRRGVALEALCVQAVARHLQGSLPQAQEALQRALQLAGDEGWIRVFVDLGAPMRHLLVRERAAGAGGEGVERLLAAFGEAAPVASAAAAPLAEPIRERELDVLRCLAAGMSSPEMAGHLFLSPNTVKTHLRNLYGKLGVQKRSDALRRGRELGLIGG
jgi:LuxR family maltose regulon positive regulatory protein